MAISQRATSGPTTSATSTLTLTKPAGTLSTDVMIATIKDDTDGGVTAPGSWVLIQQQADVGNGTTSMWWAFGSEASLAFTVSGTGSIGTVVSYIGCDPTTPIGPSAKSSTAGGVSPFTWTAPSITTTIDNSWRLVGFGYADFTIGAAPTFTETGTTQRLSGAFLDTGLARIGISIGDVNITPPGATGTTSATATGGTPTGGTQQAIAVALQPQAPTPSDEGGGFIYLPARRGISLRIG